MKLKSFSTFVIFLLITQNIFAVDNAELYKSGVKKYNEQNYQEAIDDFTTILESDSEVRAINWVYMYRGLALSAMKNHVSAIKDYDMAFESLFENQLMAPEFLVDNRKGRNAWPSLKSLLIIRNSYFQVKLEVNESLLLGKWYLNDFSTGYEISKEKYIGFDESEFIDASQDTIKKYNYEVLFESNDKFVIALTNKDDSENSNPTRFMIAGTGAKMSKKGLRVDVEFIDKIQLATYYLNEDRFWGLVWRNENAPSEEHYNKIYAQKRRYFKLKRNFFLGLKIFLAIGFIVFVVKQIKKYNVVQKVSASNKIVALLIKKWRLIFNIAAVLIGISLGDVFLKSGGYGVIILLGLIIPTLVVFSIIFIPLYLIFRKSKTKWGKIIYNILYVIGILYFLVIGVLAGAIGVSIL